MTSGMPDHHAFKSLPPPSSTERYRVVILLAQVAPDDPEVRVTRTDLRLRDALLWAGMAKAAGLAAWIRPVKEDA